MESLLVMIVLTILLIWIAIHRSIPEPTRYLISVQPAARPAGWGWLFVLLAVGLAAVVVVGWK